MNPTIQFLKKRFSQYYQTTKILMPERFTRREWGFRFIGESFMQRHLAFRKSSDLVRFLSGTKAETLDNKKRFGSETFRQKLIPAHVYYSSAYYQEPGLQPMAKKFEGWLGADLIFDLDDDHLRGVEELTYEERLERVKDIVRNKLLDDFILSDFGFDQKYIKIAFSGSRGYHIHVCDPKVFQLSSAHRRDLVDYLTGVGLNMDRIFPDEIFETKEYGGKKYSKKPKVVTPKLNSPGWKGRMARGIFELIKKLTSLPEDDAMAELDRICANLRHRGKKINPDDIKSIYNELNLHTIQKFDETVFEKRNILEIFSRDMLRDIFLNIVREHEKVEMAGETDEPVTTDIKRLIRLPTSLHAKTGFQAAALKMADLKDFDPFKDAVVFGNEPVKIRVNTPKQFKFKLKNEDFSIEKGESEQELPEFAAVYLLCQRAAEII